MLQTLARHHKPIAWFFVMLFYGESVMVPAIAKAADKFAVASPIYSRYSLKDKLVSNFPPKPTGDAKPVVSGRHGNAIINKEYHPSTSVAEDFIGGPTQPEMAAFSSVNNANMVDLFSGDFAYNIPLLDVGGYPVNLSYRAGISMDQEASWVGLGWNINPGTITRNMRGLPDDFNGINDTIKKVTTQRENKTIGVKVGADVEMTGFPVDPDLGTSIGLFHNNFKGWGLEYGLNASISSGIGAKGTLTSGLSLNNNTQDGLTITPSMALQFKQKESEEIAGSGSFAISAPYNSRSGLKGLEMSAGIRQYSTDIQNQKYAVVGVGISPMISFALPSFTPAVSIPFTSRQFTFTGKIGSEFKTFHPSLFISGYVSKQRVDPQDTLIALPAYGYLYYQDGAKNNNALLDFNREKEVMYRESPPVPNIAIPNYTYDVFSITGEGTGGMFRPYRGDIGFMHDPFIRTRDASDRLSVDVGAGDLAHIGIDLNVNRAFTQDGPWREQNSMAGVAGFRNSAGTFESVYFRNPGEKAINAKSYYDVLGGDDVVTVGLYQPGIHSSLIQATNNLQRYRNKRLAGTSQLTAANSVKPVRDKRTQVISYLTAKEADIAALSKYIDNYTADSFGLKTCSSGNLENVDGVGGGLPAEYYINRFFQGKPHTRIDPVIDSSWGTGHPSLPDTASFPSNNFSIRWKGRLKAPVTGQYTFITHSDDGVNLWLNDVNIISHWNQHDTANGIDSAKVNLIAGEIYNIRMEYQELSGQSVIRLHWKYPHQSQEQAIPHQVLYGPGVDTFPIPTNLVKEKRINSFRKENHISEISVLNSDGRRYVYGIPVYNFKQREATFSIGYFQGNKQTGLAGYKHNSDNTAGNQSGKEWYFHKEEVPAYAHSFLLSGILSPDYVDLTGNGISDDDPGDAVKFTYSKVCGIFNPSL